MNKHPLRKAFLELGKYFPINYFEVAKNGAIYWANESLINAVGFSELQEVQGKQATLFGEREWLATKSVIETKKRKGFT